MGKEAVLCVAFVWWVEGGDIGFYVVDGGEAGDFGFVLGFWGYLS